MPAAMTQDLGTKAPPITSDELAKLKEENDRLEKSIMEFTKKFDAQEDATPTQTKQVTIAPAGGIKVHKLNVLPQFAEEAMQDRGTPYTPIQCKKRGHDGTMFTS